MATRTGAAVGTWRGDAVGYRAMHQRLGPVVGLCAEGCGRKAKEWSLNRDCSGDLNSDERGQFKGRLFSTQAQNYSPRCYQCHAVQDGRVGESHRWAKLTADNVREIRSTSTGKYGEQTAFARRFGVTNHAIWRVLNLKCWKDV